MAFQVSPGVLVKEIDLTNVVPASATSIGAIVGAFEKGPMNEVIPIGSERELIQVFGKPNNTNFENWFTAANFLQYGNALRVVRIETGARNAVSGGGVSLLTGTGDGSTTDFTLSQTVTDADLLEVAVDGTVTTAFSVSGTTLTMDSAPANSATVIAKLGVKITNDDDYDNNYADGQGSFGNWASKYPGEWGNSLGVSICGSADAYEKVNVTTTTATEPVNETSIAVTETSGFQVGDVVYFQETSGQQYEVTAISAPSGAGDLTIRRFDDPKGGGLKTEIASGTQIRRRWKYYDLFDAAPGTSDWAVGLGLGSTNADEMHIVVYDTQGKITGYDSDVAGNRGNAVIETFEFVSKHPKAKTAQGGTNYYVDIMNRNSAYVWWMDHPSAGTNWGTDITSVSTVKVFTNVTLPIADTLSTATDDFSPTSGETLLAYDYFADPDIVDINLVMGGKTPDSTDGTTHVVGMIDLVEGRKDCVAFVSPRREDVVGITSGITQTLNVKAFFDGIASSSYAVFDSGYKYMYDRYNDVYRYVPLNGDIAGLCANTDNVADPWFSPGGLNRGQIRGAVKLAYNPTKSQRDILYPARINPVVTFPGQGTILFGDKTALAKPSAFDRINVRRLFLVLEKSIARAAKFQLFEFNDDFTRAQFKSLVEPFLRDVQGRRGITDFNVVCDGSNNTGEVIDRNEFVADIYIKPARSINFITLNFIAVRTGVAFSEIGG
jgi:phage tail sheath protein FI